MICSDCTNRLNDYHDATLPPAETAAVDVHLATCAACRAELASLRHLRGLTAALPRDLPPARDLWPAIAAELGPAQPSPVRPGSSGFRLPPFAFRLLLPLATAATIIFLSTLLSPLASRLSLAPAWSVAAMTGAPQVAARPVSRETPFRVGQWLETDANSTAKVAVGSIGEVRVEPNSRVRLAGVAAHDHRLQLARGTLDALIWAPPRLFFVDTPFATAIDLGCAYTLTVNDAGDSELTVTAGYVALTHGDRESIVRSGNKCLTRKDAGPGTPFSVTAPEQLRAALEAFDFGPASARLPSLETILTHARRDDEVTLWHLLSRTAGPQLAATFDTLARVSDVPPGVTREGILAGNAQMRRAWANALGLGPAE